MPRDTIDPHSTLFLEDVSPNQFDSNWLDGYVNSELLVDNAYRRSTMFNAIGQVFNGLDSQWSLSHSALLNEIALTEVVKFRRKGFKYPVIEMTILSIAKDSSDYAAIEMGVEGAVTKTVAAERIDAFCKEYPRVMNEHTASHCKTLLNKMIGACGSSYQITAGASVSGLEVPSMRLKVRRLHQQYDFTVGMLILSSFSMGQRS